MWCLKTHFIPINCDSTCLSHKRNCSTMSRSPSHRTKVHRRWSYFVKMLYTCYTHVIHMFCFEFRGGSCRAMVDRDCRHNDIRRRSERRLRRPGCSFRCSGNNFCVPHRPISRLDSYNVWANKPTATEYTSAACRASHNKSKTHIYFYLLSFWPVNLHVTLSKQLTGIPSKHKTFV